MTEDTYLERPVMIHYSALLNGFHLSFIKWTQFDLRRVDVLYVAALYCGFFSWPRCGIDKGEEYAEDRVSEENRQ